MSVFYNDNPIFLKECLTSINNSIFNSICEVVIVKDGDIGNELSTVFDNLQIHQNLRFKIIELHQNKGLGAALNAGIQECTYQFIARMDADDIVYPSRFIKQIEFLKSNPMVDIVGTFAMEIDAEGNHGNIRSMPISHDDICQSLWACPFIHPSIMFRKDKILAAGNYNPNFRRRQDYELWFRCARYGLIFANIPEPLLYYRFDHNTHKKQSLRLAWEQAKIGYIGSSSLNLSWWKRAACFIPFFRALLPPQAQHFLYRVLKRFDPRKTN